MIEKEILEQYGAIVVSYVKGEHVFHKGTMAKHYYQIINGGVKMNFYNESGNEFIQGIFGKGKSFGEPPLLVDLNYPANAVAISDTNIYRLGKSDFKQLLLENSAINFEFSKIICDCLLYTSDAADD